MTRFRGFALVPLLTLLLVPSAGIGAGMLLSVEKTRDGCLLSDDFNDGIMDTSSVTSALTPWQPLYADSSLDFREINGYFQVFGNTGPVYVGQHRGIQTNPYTYQGWSIASLETLELVSIVDMQDLDPLSPAIDDIGHNTEARIAHHYCSNCYTAGIDNNATVSVGYLLGTATGPGWDPPGGKWGYRVKWDDAYSSRYLSTTGRLFGDEAVVMHPTMVDNYGFDAGDSTLATGYVWADGAWVVLGSRKLQMWTCRKTELKSMCGWARNRNIDYRWDNFRLFPHSRRYPVEFTLVDADSNLLVGNYSLVMRRTGGGAVADIDTIGVDAQFRLHLDHTTMILPTSLRFVLLEELVDSIATFSLPASGVTGCYPNDAYVIRLDTTSAPPDDGDEGIAPIRPHLEPNVPNPWNPRTKIAYEIPGGSESVFVTLRVYDLSGRLVRSLVDEPRGAGSHEVWWDGTDRRGAAVPSGVYFYRLEAAGFDPETRRMVLLR